ncbi:hypothetical protein KP509_24G038300 [Ceratopteris richardii]|uniref:SHSP domain-containing protein n=1 Tax=Ceratopteris richardii TaxID=49495 RepID=A0A8T2RUM1_CERRI|nr:hypothetical protein KP509_1Z202900 [Ceratopteris richardii]KAH6556125.1 hypothetical protein KP509_1Z203100 [Ceratopteris richardii]KAH6556126.1 hypothetical protein KP509_1Z203200 [Ceratopteris richardii]KAH6556561.1 hypothetical protein KP509_1Z170300 [Ceratopteris richardii]KAH6556562.1 hypothetical protein KP509_1Z170400 [Ceratopteris richardii]
MALSLFGNGRRSGDVFDSMLFDPFAFPSVSSLLNSRFHEPHHSSFARDVAAVANTQVDWKETDAAHIFKANLPGLSKEEVKVQLEEGHVLVISGERKKEESSSTDRWHRVERSHGAFLRRFRLPENVKVDEVRAAMENGVLTVSVPKCAPQPKVSAKSIDISG